MVLVTTAFGTWTPGRGLGAMGGDHDNRSPIMRALVVYESLYGNTHIIANSIAEGLRDKACDVTVLPVNRATAELVRETDLLVVGGPTHMHGMSSTSSRRMAVEAARKPGSGLTLEPVALAPGLREWLHGIGPRQGLAAAAFDTRYEGPVVFTGRASSGIAHRLLRHGYRLVVSPESFLISKQNALIRTEANRAKAWGAALAFAAQPAQSG
jgi:Flavodoxin